jgi:hypothetical protein
MKFACYLRNAELTDAFREQDLSVIQQVEVTGVSEECQPQAEYGTGS